MGVKRVKLIDQSKYLGRKFIEQTKNDYEVIGETDTKYQIIVNYYCTMFVNKYDCLAFVPLDEYLSKDGE